ncbi:MAG: ATP-binding protein [Hyphomonas sp.]
MTDFQIDTDLEIGTVFEVAGSVLKIALSRNISELTRSYSGRVYDVGQIGSILKLHLGRRIIFATVKLLRLQSDEETAVLSASIKSVASTQDRRVIEADLLGEAIFNSADNSLVFKRGVSTYPLPLQAVHLITKEETELLFSSVERSRDDGVRSHAAIGSYVGATRVECRADIDRLFGQHCAVLGSTGAGKSSAVAAIIHSVLEHECRQGVLARPSIILIDPHGEYANAFGERAQVFRAYDSLGLGENEASNLKLPYWLLSSDEFRSLVIGKTEFEATSQANTVYKALVHARMCAAGMVASASTELPTALGADHDPEEPLLINGTTPEQVAGFDRDRPRPFKLAEFRDHILNRQAIRAKKGSGWERVPQSEFQRDFASILNKYRVLTTDPRIAFLMEELNESSPTLDQVLSQFLNVDSGDSRSLKIIDISGLPNEVAGPLTGAIGRLLFQYKIHQTRAQREKDPVLFVCEEAHRYVPNRGDAQYEVAQGAIRRIAREGRKYGLGLMLVSQRPADIEGTVISQCNSWIILRLSNSTDQEHVARFLPDGLSGMTKMLSSLPRQEALFVGEAAAIPARIKLRTLTKSQLPNSNDISFAAGWSSEGTTEDEIHEVVGRMQS